MRSYLLVTSIFLAGCAHPAKQPPPPQGDPSLRLSTPITVDDSGCTTTRSTKLNILSTPPQDALKLVEPHYRNVVWYRGDGGEIVLEESEGGCGATFQHVFRRTQDEWHECATFSWACTP